MDQNDGDFDYLFTHEVISKFEVALGEAEVGKLVTFEELNRRLVRKGKSG